MAYVKQNFVKGQILTAEHMNHIEDGIIAAADAQSLGGVAAGSYALKTDVAPDSALLGGKAPAYYLQPRNLLDNSDFTNPVNQRGKTSYTGTGYVIDRWRSWMDSNTLTIHDGYITTTGDYAQYIKGLGEGTYSAFAMRTDGTLIQIDTGYESPNDWRYVSLPAGSYVWAALYEGAYTADTLPPYVPKGYAAELAECQRYYRSYSTTTLNGWFNNGGETAVLGMDTSGMRITPTVICSVNSAKCNGSNINGSSLSGPSVTAMELRLTMSNGSAYSMQAVSVRFNSLVFNADL